jgi:hypothetical protein
MVKDIILFGTGRYSLHWAIHKLEVIHCPLAKATITSE